MERMNERTKTNLSPSCTCRENSSIKAASPLWKNRGNILCVWPWDSITETRRVDCGKKHGRRLERMEHRWQLGPDNGARLMSASVSLQMSMRSAPRWPARRRRRCRARMVPSSARDSYRKRIFNTTLFLLVWLFFLTWDTVSMNDICYRKN